MCLPPPAKSYTARPSAEGISGLCFRACAFGMGAAKSLLKWPGFQVSGCYPMSRLGREVSWFRKADSCRCKGQYFGRAGGCVQRRQGSTDSSTPMPPVPPRTTRPITSAAAGEERSSPEPRNTASVRKAVAVSNVIFRKGLALESMPSLLHARYPPCSAGARSHCVQRPHTGADAKGQRLREECGGGGQREECCSDLTRRSLATHCTASITMLPSP